MPSIHIPEAVFEQYVEQEGGYSEAKAKIKEVAEEGLE